MWIKTWATSFRRIGAPLFLHRSVAWLSQLRIAVLESSGEGSFSSLISSHWALIQGADVGTPSSLFHSDSSLASVPPSCCGAGVSVPKGFWGSFRVQFGLITCCGFGSTLRCAGSGRSILDILFQLRTSARLALAIPLEPSTEPKPESGFWSESSATPSLGFSVSVSCPSLCQKLIQLREVP